MRQIKSREVVCKAIELVGDLVGADYDSGLGINDALDAIDEFVGKGADAADRAARARMVYGLLGRAASNLSALSSSAATHLHPARPNHVQVDRQDDETPIGYVVRMMIEDALRRPHNLPNKEGPHN